MQEKNKQQKNESVKEFGRTRSVASSTPKSWRELQVVSEWRGRTPHWEVLTRERKERHSGVGNFSTASVRARRRASILARAFTRFVSLSSRARPRNCFPCPPTCFPVARKTTPTASLSACTEHTPRGVVIFAVHAAIISCERREDSVVLCVPE